MPNHTLSNPFPLKLLFQHSQLAKEYIVIHVRPLQPPLTLCSIESLSSMQHPPIIKDDALPLIQPILIQILLRTKQLLVRMRSSNEGAKRRGIAAADTRFEGALERWRPVYTADGEVCRVAVVWIGEGFNHWPGEVVMVGRVVVVICYGKCTQRSEVSL